MVVLKDAALQTNIGIWKYLLGKGETSTWTTNFRVPAASFRVWCDFWHPFFNEIYKEIKAFSSQGLFKTIRSWLG